ncbi:MAG: ankyrin repeat domain-containing protein [Gammaproteobacteria bacterium]
MSRLRSFNFTELLKRIQSNDKTLDSKLEIDSISEAELIQLAIALKKNTIIKELKINKIHDLQLNKLDESVRAIGDLIQNNKTLVTLDLGDASIDTSGAYRIVPDLYANTTLRTIKVETQSEFLIKALAQRARNQNTTDIIHYCAYLIEELLGKILEKNKDEKLVKAIIPINETLVKALARSDEVNFESLIEAFSKIIPLLSKTDAKEAESLKVLLDLINSYHKEIAITPLHAIARIGDVEHLALLVNEFHIDPNSKDNQGWTPLHIAVYFNQLSVAKDLIEKYHADVNAKTEEGQTPLILAKAKGYTELVAYLQSHDKEIKGEKKGESKHSEEKVRVGRRLYSILGGEKLTKKVTTEGTDIHAVGGIRSTEGYETLSHYLKEYAQQVPSRNFTGILKHLDSVAVISAIDVEKTGEAKSPKEFIQKAKEAEEATKKQILKFLSSAEPGTRQIIASGHIKHTMGFSLEKNSKDTFTLYVADRGSLSDAFSSREQGKNASIKGITFKADKLETVLDLLYLSDGSTREMARQILFEKIPEAVDAKYVEDPRITQSQFKTQICYFANPKTILYQEFVSEFGEKAGKNLYKQFTTFMREKVVEDYEKIVGSKDPFVIAGKEVVAHKKNKLFKSEMRERKRVSRKGIDHDETVSIKDDEEGRAYGDVAHQKELERARLERFIDDSDKVPDKTHKQNGLKRKWRRV